MVISSRYTMSDAVTTFVYASAVNVLFASSVGLRLWQFVITLSLILFLAVDWLGRISIPASLSPVEDQEARRHRMIQLLKGGVEITCVYLLVAAGLAVTVPDSYKAGAISREWAFLLFFFASYGWNLIALFIMKQLEWAELFSDSLTGWVFERESNKVYAARLYQRLRKAEEGLVAPGSKLGAKQAWTGHHRAVWRMALARAGAQFAAFHIVAANLLAGVLLALRAKNVLHLEAILAAAPTRWRWIALGVAALLALVVLVCFYRYSDSVSFNDGERAGDRYYRWSAATAFWVLAVLGYAVLSSRGLIVTVMIQHVAFGLFVQYSIPRAIDGDGTICKYAAVQDRMTKPEPPPKPREPE